MSTLTTEIKLTDMTLQETKTIFSTSADPVMRVPYASALSLEEICVLASFKQRTHSSELHGQHHQKGSQLSLQGSGIGSGITLSRMALDWPISDKLAVSLQHAVITIADLLLPTFVLLGTGLHYTLRRGCSPQQYPWTGLERELPRTGLRTLLLICLHSTT